MRVPLAIIILLTFRLSAFGQATGADSIRLELLLKASRADSVHKDYLSAVRHLNEYLYLKDSVLESAKKHQVAQLQQQYQTAKKDREIQSGEKNISLLTGQNSLMNKNLQQARSIRKITTIIVIAAALLLLLSYLQYRLKTRTNLRLENQERMINQKNDSLQHMAQQKDMLLEEKELLIKEIHHRVKNNLQVVISLLNTQSAYLNDPLASAAIRQSQHRMQAISLIHQKLYQSESRALINIKEYTHELVQYLQQSFDSAGKIVCKLAIADIELDVLRAVPIGLILNEAITNSIKYAFPADSDGSIEVELNAIDEQQLKLTVCDDGLGLPPEFNIDVCQSLGINLMKNMSRQISGQLIIENKKGLLVAVEFPMVSTLSQLSSADEISSFHDNVNQFQFQQQSQHTKDQ